jgi:A/G-specific adenine glycosylase
MLQQTQVATVVPYYGRFLETFPRIEDLAEASEEAVLAAWSGLGYYRRARALHDGACVVAERHGGRVPEDPAALLALPGVGPYTAGAIASIAFGLPEPVLDGNVRRVLSRLLARRGTGAAEERALWRVARDLARGPDPGDLNQALMELGALVCTPRSPRCADCPARAHCLARASGRPESFPLRRRAEAVQTVRVAVALVEHRGRVLLGRRTPGTPLSGAWDLPSAEIPEGVPPRRRLNTLLATLGVRATTGAEIARVRHAILHRRLAIEVIACRPEGRVAEATDNARWVRPGDLGGVAISAATRKILEAAGLAPAGPGAARVQKRSQGGTHASARSRPRSESGSRSSGRSKR